MIEKVKQEFHITINADGKTAVDWLAEATDFSKQKLKHCMQQGCVWLARNAKTQNEVADDAPKGKQQAYVQRLRRAKKLLNAGDELHFYYDESVLNTETSPATLVKDLGDYSIWNKPSGMLSQGSKWADHSTIYRWAETHLKPERPAFIVHRLDRAANGLIILAHKKSVASQFSRMFENREIDKRYHVEVQGDFTKMITAAEGVLTIDNEIDGKTAISHVKMLAFNKAPNTSSLEVNIETGRKHQIRKHLSDLGYPVLGDRFYDSTSKPLLISPQTDKDLQLSAVRLSFICPVSLQEKIFKL